MSHDDLEDRLRRSSEPTPSDLRQRVLAAVREELTVHVVGTRSVPATLKRPSANQAAAIALTAAVVLLWSQLAWTSALGTHLPQRTTNADNNGALALAIVREIAPELSAADAQGLTTLLRFGS
jgi:hypothetical protein